MHLNLIVVARYDIIAYENISVNCEWGEWNIQECTKTCGGGTKLRTRNKVVIEASGGTCSGQHRATESCNTISCPGDSL